MQLFVDGARSQSHTVTLTGLTPGTLYSYRVGSQDVARNPVVFSEVKNFKEFLGKTDLICASNVICHVPNLKDLIESIDLLLSSDGTFVFEEPYPPEA